MGHFGRSAIARAWSPFYPMAPSGLLIPLLLLATAATIIASQSIIRGAFSVMQQAVQLGYLPRVNIIHTSEEARGQVFAPTVNMVLLVAVIVLVLAFAPRAHWQPLSDWLSPQRWC